MRPSTLIPIIASFLAFAAGHAQQPALPGAQPLEMQGDIASNMVAGVDRFLLRKLQESEAAREKFWKRDTSSHEAFLKSVEPNRERLREILGLRDSRVTNTSPRFLEGINSPSLVATAGNYRVHQIEWDAFGDVKGIGLIAIPDGKPVARMVVIPDADQTPEELFGLADGEEAAGQVARRLAEQGCMVVVPVVIDRKMEKRRSATLTNREFLYRPAFVLGRTLIGYEIQKILALVDWFESETEPATKIGVVGWGEGGLLALYSAAVDTRIDAAMVSGYFGERRNLWKEPLDRNLFGLLEQFGDAEIATLVLRRHLIIEARPGPEFELPSNGGAPAELFSPSRAEVMAEVERLGRLNRGVLRPDGQSQFYDAGVEGALEALLDALAPNAPRDLSPPTAMVVRSLPDADERMRSQIHEIDRHNQRLLTESPYVRAEFMKKLDHSSLEKFEESARWYREYFAREIIGQFDDPLLPANPRARQSYSSNSWTGYEVALDVFPDVFAYGVLLVPKDIKPGERRPVVVCQHGLEGRPQEIIMGDHHAYHDFASKLAERGFITFSPQNLYIGRDRFRTLQRKANPLKKTLFSIITPQHQQIVNWLKTLPMVDAQRVGFYGLSYGGKTAMRVPALITDYTFSICSADFNEWVWKNASTRSPYSYAWMGEYEIFEWDLGSTFNYAEMAALIAPRPFMVERGHFDGVAPDETVAYEYAKVRHLYAAKLRIPERTEIEWFSGPHTINGQGTFEFVHKHHNWPKP